MGPVQLVFDGRFAAQVAAATADLLDTVRLVPLADVPADPAELMAEGTATVLVTARYDWREVHLFDDAGRRAGRPWCFAGYAYPYVFVGPYAAPAGGPCYLCLRTRLGQHGRTELPLDGVHVPVHGDHVEGIPPHLVHPVAGLLAGLLDPAGGHRTGSLSLVHVNGFKVRAEALIGVHGCGRCGDASERGDLRRAVRDLWTP
jgi:bacteriocin biosynthesis cyclodehydratase domain-containing protein